MKIPVRKRYKFKIYKRGRNEHSYIQTWLEQNSDDDEDIPEFDAVVKQGKKSIAASKKAIEQKREQLVSLQAEVQERIAEIQQQRKEIAEQQEAIDIKRRAVKKVRRQKKIEESDIIPNLLAPNTPLDAQPLIDKDAPGAETVGQTGSFAPIKSEDSEDKSSSKDNKQ